MRISSGFRRLAAAAVGGGMLLAGLPAGTAAAAGTPATDWVTYGPVPAGATVQTVQGGSDGQGGCTLDLSTDLPLGSSAARFDEVAFSPGTCQSQVAVTTGDAVAAETPEPDNTSQDASGDVTSQPDAGQPSPEPSGQPTPQPSGQPSSQPSGQPSPQATDAQGRVAVAAVAHSAGYLKSWYEDPVGIVVNSVQNGTDWWWDGTCVVAPVSGGRSYRWFAPSGWMLAATRWTNVFTCARSTSSSYAHYENGIFCAFITTHTYYDLNTINGLANGSLAGNVRASKRGGCNKLLSFHAVVRRTI